MNDYRVYFGHSTQTAIETQVPVRVNIMPADAAENFELIVECAYGVLNSIPMVGLDDIDIDDLSATKITHNGELIIDFTAE